jgi:hypothetical protein
MPGVGLNPLGLDEPKGAQPIEQGVSRALDDDQLRTGFKMPEDLKPVEASVPERSEDRQLEGAFAELDLPLL